jgi:hypothetical protein
MHTKYWSENMKERDDLENRDKDGRLIWKWILKKQGVRVWTWFAWIKIGTSICLFERIMNFRYL